MSNYPHRYADNSPTQGDPNRHPEDRLLEEDLAYVEEHYSHQGPFSSPPGQDPSSPTGEDMYQDEDYHHHDKEGEDPQDFPMYPMRELSYGPVSLNPLTTLIGICLLWGLSIWCILEPEQSLDQLLAWRGSMTQYFTWLYIGTRPVFVFFLVYVYFKYGHIKLGPPDSVPDYSNVTYFSMLLSAGVAVGLFYYGVSEPLWHQNSHWYAQSGYHSQDEIGMFALNLTLVHWGLPAWSAYVVCALAIALASFRFNLPMTFRSCFYPILGEYTWGWMGDIIDGFAIVVTVSGVCTSLGLGAFQVLAGMQRIGIVDSEISEDNKSTIQIIVVWGITLAATASVVSGLNKGIKYLSILAFCIGLVLIFLLLTLEKTSYLLNLQVQSVGYYFQHSVFQLSFWTDAFGQLKEGEGRATDGNAAATWWMDSWTVFYMAWWTSWSGFVGIFVGCTSKGRTIREVILYSMMAPLFFAFVWFGIWGGIGLRQDRQAKELQKLGQDFYGNPAEFLRPGTTNCFDVPQVPLIQGDTEIYSSGLIGVTPVCAFDTKNPDSAFFNVLYSFSYPADFIHGFGPFLSGLSIIATIIYFITSSDSGSLVVDFMASNGNLEHHWIQRVFWAATEGAVATALLRAGGSDALKAVQAASIIAGLPFTIFLIYILQSIIVMCSTADEAPNDTILASKDNKNEFQMPVYGGVFNILEFIFSLGQVHEDRVACGMDLPTVYEVTEFFYGLFVPFIPLAQVLSVLKPKPKDKWSNRATVLFYALMHVTWVVLFILTNQSSGLRAFAWCALLINGCILTNVKANFRKQHNYRGNYPGDVISSIFLFPQVLCQLRVECEDLNIHFEEDLMAKSPEEAPVDYGA